MRRITRERLGLFFQQLSKEFQVLAVFRSAGGFFHPDHILERREINVRLANPSRNFIFPDFSEGNTLYERMDVRFKDVLANEDLVGQEIGNREIGEIIAELAKGFHDPANILARRFDEKINIERCPGISVCREGRRADNDVYGPIFV